MSRRIRNLLHKLDILCNQINDPFRLCSVVTGGFNGRCKNWCKDDITNSTGREHNIHKSLTNRHKL